MSFAEVHATFSWDEDLSSIQKRTSADVLKSLDRAENGLCDLEYFKNLVSHEDERYLAN